MGDGININVNAGDLATARALIHHILDEWPQETKPSGAAYRNITLPSDHANLIRLLGALAIEAGMLALVSAHALDTDAHLVVDHLEAGETPHNLRIVED